MAAVQRTEEGKHRGGGRSSPIVGRREAVDGFRERVKLSLLSLS